MHFKSIKTKSISVYSSYLSHFQENKNSFFKGRSLKKLFSPDEISLPVAVLAKLDILYTVRQLQEPFQRPLYILAVA